MGEAQKCELGTTNAEHSVNAELGMLSAERSSILADRK